MDVGVQVRPEEIASLHREPDDLARLNERDGGEEADLDLARLLHDDEAAALDTWDIALDLSDSEVLDVRLEDETRLPREDNEARVQRNSEEDVVSGEPPGADEEGERVDRLLSLVRELARTVPTTSLAATGGGRTNLGFDATDVSSDDSSGEEIDWSWLADETQLCTASSTPPARPPRASWLRESMRRVRRFALSAPPEPAVVNSAPTSTSCRPRSAPGAATVPCASEAAPLEPPASSCRPQSAPSQRHDDVAVTVPCTTDTASSCRPRSAPVACGGTERLPPLQSPLHLAAPVPTEEVVVPPETPDFPRRYSQLGRQEEVQSTPVLSDSSADEEYSECEVTADDGEGCKQRWPHALSSLLAALGCTLGLFNVARFALLSVHFGGNFIGAWTLLSVLLGWPLHALHATLGEHLRAGAVDMWRVAPIFQGVGVALLAWHAALGLYTVVGVAWMFTYFRDAFVNRQDAYRWAENGTQLEYSVPEYLKTVVLQREGTPGVGHLKFQVTFNLAVVWMIVFVCLSKGIKSYGKAVHVLGLVPLVGLLSLTIKMLTVSGAWWFPDNSEWGDFFSSTHLWSAAAVECFSTWGLLGAATMQLRAHGGSCRLDRELLIVLVVTATTLVSAGLLANCFRQMLEDEGFFYVPSTFERGVFLARTLPSTPARLMPHAYLLVGTSVSVPYADTAASGYQVLRLATELAPAALAALGPDRVSPFWTVTFYFTLITLGVGQQLCIWHCVITGVIAINQARLQAWETTITFLSCASAFVLGLPLTTELGALILYYLDYCMGGCWWLAALMAVQVVAALMARGGERVARTLLGARHSVLQATLVFTWNLALPVALTVASVVWFKSNGYRDLYTGRQHGTGYWPAWARRLGCLMQLAPLLLVPLVAAVQTWRHLASGPHDLFDRLRLLCRPESFTQSPGATSPTGVTAPTTQLPALPVLDDPPPKYTPPPSYATATGARIAKLLRRSFRRLVGPAGSAPDPPAYSAALVEMGGVSETDTRPTSTLSANQVARLLRSSMRRTLRSSAPGVLTANEDANKPVAATTTVITS